MLIKKEFDVIEPIILLILGKSSTDNQMGVRVIMAQVIMAQVIMAQVIMTQIEN